MITPIGTSRLSDRSFARGWRLPLSVLGLLFLLHRLAAVSKVSINGDEFALLARAEHTFQSGELISGGRPGLATLVLVPFVSECTDSVAATINSRMAWLALTLSCVVGLFVLVRRWLHVSGLELKYGESAPVAAVALYVAMPSFIDYSIQVRSDQGALAFGILGACLALGTRWWSGLLAGVMFAVAVLFTQKAIYVIAMAAWLTVMACWSRVATYRSQLRTEVQMLAGLVIGLSIGAAFVGSVYYFGVPRPPSVMTSGAVVADNLETMRLYAKMLGFRAYLTEARLLPVHVLLAALIIGSGFFVLQNRYQKERIVLLTISGLWILTIAVGVLHGSRFPYFLMTLGIFISVSLGIGLPVSLQMFEKKKVRPLLIMGLTLLFVMALPMLLTQSNDTQSNQRNAMRVVQDPGLRGLRGWQNEGALFCKHDPDYKDALFTLFINQLGEAGPGSFDQFLDDFRDRPISFIVDSYRMVNYPSEVRRFWSEHYVAYRDGVLLAGFPIAAGEPSRSVEVISPGSYRWWPAPGRDREKVVVNNQQLSRGDTVHLAIGWHTLKGVSEKTAGILSLATVLPPDASRQPFYADTHAPQIVAAWSDPKRHSF